ncbi:MAG TPA: efflux RND transporter periplasmic adaptor subunit [Vicinamibacterales bacterium]|nr:efflux RND transporter periplasmic adaptor subunit [Vicinamibacterales bacterium]
MNRRSLLLLTALFMSSCSHDTPEEVESETVVPVVTEPAAKGNIRATITVTGIVTAAPDADQLVVAPQAARIAEIPKAEGERVRSGDVLVRFEIPELVADVASKRAEVARAQARITNATAAQTRAHDLFDRGVAARKEVEDADRELADARAGLTEAQATLGSSESSAARSTVHARFDGVVAKRFHNPGDLVEAASSDPVIRVVDPRRLEVTASVPIPDVPKIVVGAAGELRSSTGAEPIALKVISRPAAVDPGTASVPIRLSFGVPDVAPIGTPVQVTINAEEHRNVILVPAGAVIREGEEAAVFIANGDKAERRVVTVGLSDSEHAEIISGLKAGETVIVKGQAGLPDGAAISVGKAEPEK